MTGPITGGGKRDFCPGPRFMGGLGGRKGTKFYKKKIRKTEGKKILKEHWAPRGPLIRLQKASSGDPEAEHPTVYRGPYAALNEPPYNTMDEFQIGSL